MEVAEKELAPSHLKLKSTLLTSAGLSMSPSPRGTNSLCGVSGQDREWREGAVDGTVDSCV